MAKPLVNCIFCGLNKPSSREHVVQDALGGVDVLTNVCGSCNHRLSLNDKVLAVESGLAIFVHRELMGVGPNSWDVDEARNGLLLEARTTPGTDSMTLVPQLIFDGDERLIYCDADDIKDLRPVEVEDRFYARLRSAFGHFKLHGPVRLHRRVVAAMVSCWLAGECVIGEPVAVRCRDVSSPPTTYLDRYFPSGELFAPAARGQG